MWKSYQPRSPRHRFLGVVAAAIAGCSHGPLEVDGAPSQSFSTTVGREIDITLQNVGPGEYASPPALSSTALRFIDASVVTPAVPAGLTQRFRFQALQAGDAVITFHQVEGEVTVQDTVHVE